MTTLNPCCATLVPTQRPRLLRWAQALQETLSAAGRHWHAARRLHAEQRALEGLPDATLRDIGLAERGRAEPTLNRFDWERGGWQ
jgi:uncharacterized protein YjiS (DUF1127 family)